VYGKIIILIFYFISFSSFHGSAVETEEFFAGKYLDNVNGLNYNLTKPLALSNCPGNLTKSISAGCEVSVTWPEPTTDNILLRYVQSTHNSGDIFPVGKTTVTYVERNLLSGDTTDICSFIVEVTLDPSYAISNCPSNVVIDLNTSCDRRVLWFEPEVACGISLASNKSPGDEFPIGTTTVTYSAFEGNRIYGTCSFTVTLNDNTPPVFDTCPNNITLDANENCEAVGTWTLPEASDNCGFAPALTSNFANGSTLPIGTTTVTYTATDEGGNTATCSFDVIVSDNTGPEFLNIPSELRIDADENCEATATWDEILADDNCSSNVVINSNFNSGDEFPLGETIVEYSATDEADNETISSFSVIVEDNTDPSTSNCPTNIIVFANSNCEATATWIVPNFTDNCDSSPQVASSHNPGDVFPIGDTEVIYTATDEAGNEALCSFIVTVEDNTPPTFTSVPDNLVVSAQSDACEATVNWDGIIVEDNCDATVAIATNFNSGDVFTLGETTVEITATDDSGNESSSSFLVTVVDDTPPQVLSIPNDITVSASTDCNAVVNWTIPTFTDNCDADLQITSTHNSGDVFPLGETLVSYTAIDDEDNDTVSSFKVIVVDDSSPIFISCVSDIVLTANNQCQATASWQLPEVSDNCSSEITLESDFDSGDVFPQGTTMVTYTATDATGNSSTCSFDVIVNDNTPPTIISNLNDLTVTADEGTCQATVSWNTISAEDNCDNEVQITSSFNSGDLFQIGESIVEVIAKDNAGNETSASFKVTVEDNTAPEVIFCPEDITISAKGKCESIASWEIPEFSDNCNSDLSVSSTHDPRDIFPLGTTLVTYTATDASGNQQSCNFNVIVEDDKLPDFTTCIADISLTANDQCTAIAEWLIPEVTDNCDNNVNLESDFTSGDSFPIGITTVTYTATDDAGNSNTCSFDVIVEDKSAAVLVSCPDKQIISANENCIGIAEWEEPVFDDCSNLTISSNYQKGDELPLGVTNIEYTATDINGKTTLCSFEVEVIDQSPPIITNCPDDISISASDDCEAIVDWEIPTALDNCTEVSANSNFEPGTVFPIGITTVEYEFTDEYGNRSLCSFMVTVEDQSEIIINNCPEDIFVTAENSNGLATVNWEVPRASAACSELVVDASHNPGEAFEVGTTEVTYTFTKENGVSENCTFDVTVEPLILDIQISRLITPNGDGNNDNWRIEGLEKFPNNQVIVVDRWGTEIYKSSGYNNNEVVWKGENRSGEMVPRGTYYYFVTVRNEQDVIQRKGYLEVLR
tara:strand:+ start:157461 stop:161270 length:3810 start_codon:yes stop_codon:yes gene_type:complete